MAGVALISLDALHSGADTRTSSGQVIAGLLCAVGALVSWSWYAVANARRLALVGGVSSRLGLAHGPDDRRTGAGAGDSVLGPEVAAHGAATWVHFVLVAAGVALLSSVVGGAFWNQASRLLPLALSGQVLVVETLAALLFGFCGNSGCPVRWSWLLLRCWSVAWSGA